MLLVQRTPKARFMGGVWVFPGGAVDAAEGEGDARAPRCRVRELAEEAAIEGRRAPTASSPFSRSITPREVSIRFDTHFFLAELPAGQQARVDGEESSTTAGPRPGGAGGEPRAGELPMVFPTIKHLQQLAPFGSVAELLTYARGREVLPVEPRVVMEGEVARIVLPGEPGYGDE